MPNDPWYSDYNQSAAQITPHWENISTTSATMYTDEYARTWFRLDLVQFKDLEKHGKINAIKHLREIFGISLVQAKDIIDGITSEQRHTKATELIADKLKDIVKDAYNAGLSKTEVTKLLELTPW